MIRIENLTKRYGNNRGVQSIDFSVKKGECMGLLGPNGAGKSTIIKMITGFISPTMGTAKINGFDLIDETDKITQCIGFMGEIPPLYLEMTVEKYLSFVTEIKGIKRSERMKEVARVMELSGTDNVGDRVVKNLSKGYRQRVGLAQALIGNPKILILDEPTAGLDPRQIVDVRNLIINLRKDHTIIISSHILSEISQICDRVVIIKEGNIIAADYIENIVGDSYDSPKFIIKINGKGRDPYPVLKEIMEIESIERLQVNAEGSIYTTCLVNSSSSHVRDKIFTRLADNNMIINELRSVGFSLEEVFLEMVD